MSVLPRLIALPETFTTAAQRTAWQAQLQLLPPLPQGPALNGSVNAQKIYPIATGEGFPTTGKGQRSNSENTELYIAHPFRLFGLGKTTDITLAQQTYLERHSPCNDGWCQVRSHSTRHSFLLNLTDRYAHVPTRVVSVRISSKRRCSIKRTTLRHSWHSALPPPTMEGFDSRASPATIRTSCRR